MTDKRRAQAEIADAVDVREVTIRNRYKELAKKLETSVEEKKGKLFLPEKEITERERKKKLGPEEIEARSKEIKPKNVRYENVVTSVNLKNIELDLEELADELGSNADYDLDEFPGVSYFQEDMEASFLISESGKANCGDTTSIEEAKEDPKLLPEGSNGKGFKVDPHPEVEIRNIVVRATFNTTL